MRHCDRKLAEQLHHAQLGLLVKDMKGIFTSNHPERDWFIISFQNTYTSATVLSLFQAMAYRLFSNKPLPE